MEPLDSVIFSLAKGEVSEVVEFNDSAYIFRISESYNTLLSLNNKQNLLA